MGSPKDHCHAHRRQTYEVFAEIHDYKAPFSAKKMLFTGQKSAILKKLRTFAMFIYMHVWLRLGIDRSNEFVGLCARLAQTFHNTDY